MATNQLVLGIFANEVTADNAAGALLAWVKDQNIVSRPVGVLVADEKGQIKEHKLGHRSGAKGAGIGLLLAVVAPPTLLVGMVGGGFLGHFHHQGLGLTDADRERIAAELAGGKAAIGVLVEDGDEAYMITKKLTELGGSAEAHEVTDEALQAVAAAAPDTAPQTAAPHAAAPGSAAP